jgi:rRNA maturation endonuclease Nob1
VALFLLLILWMVITAVVGVVVKAILRGAEADGVRALAPEPRCGACGYIVKGLPGRVCPECGSDLRVVGVE